jgi:hypothetical protein
MIGKKKWGLPSVSIVDRGPGPSAGDYEIGQSGGPVSSSTNDPSAPSASDYELGSTGIPTVSKPPRNAAKRYTPQLAQRNENSGESRTAHFGSGYNDSVNGH